MLNSLNTTPLLYPPPPSHGILPLMFDLKHQQQYLPIVSLAKSISDEAASIQMSMSMASLMRNIGWLQFLMTLCLGWYLVCHFFKRWGNPLALGRSSGFSHPLACFPLYLIFDGLQRYWLNHVCPDLASPWTPFLLSDPWKVRLAGYVFITVALYSLRLAMLTVGHMYQHLSTSFAYLSNSDFVFARTNWHRGYLDMDIYIRLFWAVWYGGYNVLYNLQLIGYHHGDRSGGRIADVLEGLDRFLKCSGGMENYGRMAGLSLGRIELAGLRSFVAIITDRLPPLGPLPNEDARHNERRARSRFFSRLCENFDRLFDEDRLAEAFQASLRKYYVYMENCVEYPTVSTLEDVPRTWYAFVFDLLGDLLGVFHATRKMYVMYLQWRVMLLTCKNWIWERVEALDHLLEVAFWFVVHLLRDMVLYFLYGVCLIGDGLFILPLLYLGRACRRLFSKLRGPVPKRQCIICTEDLTDDEAATQMDCHGRDMHLHCLLQWTRTSRSCPICRVQLEVVER